MLNRAFRMNRFNTMAYNVLLTLDREFRSDEIVTVRTEHFAVKMSRDDQRKLWRKMAPFLEEIYRKYTEKYAIEPKGVSIQGNRILLLVLPSQDCFAARTCGLPAINASGVCFGRVIVMPSPVAVDSMISGKEQWRCIVTHEFLHVLTLQKTGFWIPRWFTEAISTWEEGSKLTSDQLDMLDSALKHGRLLKLEELERGFICPDQPGRIYLSYLQARFACDYLNKTCGHRGIIEMLRLFAGKNDTRQVLQKVTSHDLAAINRDYFTYVKKKIASVRQKLKRNAEKKKSGLKQK